MTGRQFIGLCVVIAIFAVFWQHDHRKRHLVPPDETHIPTLVPQKLDPDAVIWITNNYRTAKGLTPSASKIRQFLPLKWNAT